METKTATWFEVGIRYRKIQEDSSEKIVTEKYVVDAISFSDAEARIMEEMGRFITKEYRITSEAKASYGEVVFSDDADDDNWFKCKLTFITVNEDNGKEKLTNVNFLVQANTLGKALKNITKAMSATVSDWRVTGINATKVIDVFSAKVKD